MKVIEYSLKSNTDTCVLYNVSHNIRSSSDNNFTIIWRWHIIVMWYKYIYHVLHNHDDDDDDDDDVNVVFQDL